MEVGLFSNLGLVGVELDVVGITSVTVLEDNLVPVTVGSGAVMQTWNRGGLKSGARSDQIWKWVDMHHFI